MARATAPCSVSTACDHFEWYVFWRAATIAEHNSLSDNISTRTFQNAAFLVTTLLAIVCQLGRLTSYLRARAAAAKAKSGSRPADQGSDDAAQQQRSSSSSRSTMHHAISVVDYRLKSTILSVPISFRTCKFHIPERQELCVFFKEAFYSNSRPFGGGLVRSCLCVFAALVCKRAHKDSDEQ